jgi:two-component system, OmpR family, response regulator
MKTKILLAEDDQNLGMLLSEYLEAKGFEVTLATDGMMAFEFFMKKAFDFCILDVMMPKKDGFSLSKDIRTRNPTIPIIFLTAKSMAEDTLKGFSLGGDDYITKPFSMEELLVRIQAILKRVQPIISQQAAQEYLLGKYRFNPEKHTLSAQNEDHKLTTKESKLLQVFCENQNKAVSRTYALKIVWGDDSYFNARSMDVYITKLRKYLKEEPAIQILNLHGEGFKMIVG